MCVYIPRRPAIRKPIKSKPHNVVVHLGGALGPNSNAFQYALAGVDLGPWSSKLRPQFREGPLVFREAWLLGRHATPHGTRPWSGWFSSTFGQPSQILVKNIPQRKCPFANNANYWSAISEVVPRCSVYMFLCSATCARSGFASLAPSGDLPKSWKTQFRETHDPLSTCKLLIGHLGNSSAMQWIFLFVFRDLREERFGGCWRSNSFRWQ